VANVHLGQTSDCSRAIPVIDELIDSPKKHLRGQVATLLPAQRALDDDQLERKFADTGGDVPTAFLACDNKRLAS
jgi:hypothetical protein